MVRRMADQRFTTRYFVGDGLDVGCGNDNIENFRHCFVFMQSCRGWDLPDGDAQQLSSIASNSYDFVHSSHCLEHLENPEVALSNWLRVLKPGGHLIVVVPDEDMYEQGVFPSTFNHDHKWTFTIDKPASWSPKSVGLMHLLTQFSDTAQTLKIEQLDATFNFDAPRHDQTLGPAECAIEFIMRKRPTAVKADSAVNAQAQHMQAALNATKAELQQVQAALDAAYRSHSWRVTMPLRAIVTSMRRMGVGRTR